MKKSTIYSATAALAMMALVFVLVGAQVASANPSQISRTAQTNAATTTPLFLQAPNGTSTAVVYDSYNLANSSTLFTKTDSSVLLIQVGATSTTPVLYFTVQYSNDGTQANGASYDCTVNQAGCDWYSDQLVAPIAGVVTNLDFPKLYTITGINGTSTKAFSIPTPTRYVRVRVWAVGAPASVWAQIVPAKEMTK